MEGKEDRDLYALMFQFGRYVTKRVYPDGRIERCDNVKEVALYLEKIDEMIERKRRLLADPG